MDVLNGIAEFQAEEVVDPIEEQQEKETVPVSNL